MWFSIQPIIRGIIQNTTSVLFGVWSRIQGIIIKCAGYSSASSSFIRRIIQGITQNTTSVLFSAWFRTQGIIQKIFQGIIQRLDY